MQSIQKTKEYLQTKAELALEEAMRMKKKKEKELAEMNTSKNQEL